MGRKPKPTALKELAGNPGKRKLNKSEPAGTPVESAEPPAILNDHAKEIWAATLTAFAGTNVIRSLDLVTLTVFCQAVGTWHLAETKLAESAHVGENRHGEEVVSAWYKVSVKAAQQIAVFGAKLGLSPADRACIVGMIQKPEDVAGKDLDDF